MMRSLFLLVVGFAVIWALGRHDPQAPPNSSASSLDSRADDRDEPSRPDAQEHAKYPASESASPVPERSEVRLEPGASTVGVRAALPEHREMLARAVRLGVLPDTDVVLKTDEQWAELFRMWSDVTDQIRVEATARRTLGHRIALERMERGAYQAFEVDETERRAAGDFRGPWDDKTHPDEIVSNRFMHRDGGGQIVHTVRIPPGDVPEIDDATFRIHLLNQLRRESVCNFVRQHSVR